MQSAYRKTETYADVAGECETESKVLVLGVITLLFILTMVKSMALKRSGLCIVTGGWMRYRMHEKPGIRHIERKGTAAAKLLHEVRNLMTRILGIIWKVTNGDIWKGSYGE